MEWLFRLHFCFSFIPYSELVALISDIDTSFHTTMVPAMVQWRWLVGITSQRPSWLCAKDEEKQNDAQLRRKKRHNQHNYRGDNPTSVTIKNIIFPILITTLPPFETRRVSKPKRRRRKAMSWRVREPYMTKQKRR